MHTGKRVLVIFEGRDTAGKGGVDLGDPDCLQPRQCRVVALSQADRARALAVVFPALRRAPARGRRDRAVRPQLVQPRRRREGDGLLRHRRRSREFLAQAPSFEKLLVDDGLLLFKYWLAVDQDEQEERFAERLADPLKRWKLSPIDLKAREKYAEYGKARDAMFAATHTATRRGRWSTSTARSAAASTSSATCSTACRTTDVPEAPVEFPKLKGKPAKERYTGEVKPIRRDKYR